MTKGVSYLLVCSETSSDITNGLENLCTTLRSNSTLQVPIFIDIATPTGEPPRGFNVETSTPIIAMNHAVMMSGVSYDAIIVAGHNGKNSDDDLSHHERLAVWIGTALSCHRILGAYGSAGVEVLTHHVERWRGAKSLSLSRANSLDQSSGLVVDGCFVTTTRATPLDAEAFAEAIANRVTLQRSPPPLRTSDPRMRRIPPYLVPLIRKIRKQK